MKTATANRIAELEEKLSAVCGTAVQFIVRGANKFTLTAEGDAVADLEKAKPFLSLTGRVTDWKNNFDEECDFTCAFFSINA
jgi:hypothetical protein